MFAEFGHRLFSCFVSVMGVVFTSCLLLFVSQKAVVAIFSCSSVGVIWFPLLITSFSILVDLEINVMLRCCFQSLMPTAWPLHFRFSGLSWLSGVVSSVRPEFYVINFFICWRCAITVPPCARVTALPSAATDVLVLFRLGYLTLPELLWLLDCWKFLFCFRINCTTFYIY